MKIIPLLEQLVLRIIVLFNQSFSTGKLLLENRKLTKVYLCDLKQGAFSHCIICFLVIDIRVLSEGYLSVWMTTCVNEEIK